MKKSHTLLLYLLAILCLVVFVGIKRMNLTVHEMRVAKATIGLVFVAAGFIVYYSKHRNHGS